jgi:hypothetical protein
MFQAGRATVAKWVEDDSGQDNMISLGFGAFIAPLPLDWLFEPGLPFQGRLVWPRGERLAYSIDCYEDADAAAGRDRLLDFAEEEGYGVPVDSAQAVLDDILVMVPAGGVNDDRPIVWKWLEPFAGTHVRELRLTMPLHPDIDLRDTQLNAVNEWLGYGEWAEERTRLDDLAHSAALKRETFGESLVMRVPREWRTEDLGEDGWVAEPADEHETLWLTTASFRAEMHDPADFADALTKIADGADMSPAPGHRRLREEVETLGDYDRLYTDARTEDDAEGPIRRITWRRYTWGEDILTVALIHLCTDLVRVDEPRFVDSAALIEREVRNAAVIPPRP